MNPCSSKTCPAVLWRLSSTLWDWLNWTEWSYLVNFLSMMLHCNLFRSTWRRVVERRGLKGKIDSNNVRNIIVFSTIHKQLLLKLKNIPYNVPTLFN